MIYFILYILGMKPFLYKLLRMFINVFFKLFLDYLGRKVVGQEQMKYEVSIKLNLTKNVSKTVRLICYLIPRSILK